MGGDCHLLIFEKLKTMAPQFSMMLKKHLSLYADDVLGNLPAMMSREKQVYGYKYSPQACMSSLSLGFPSVWLSDKDFPSIILMNQIIVTRLQRHWPKHVL